jgi:ABC-type antimicrobial peptide transport system permease subunit
MFRSFYRTLRTAARALRRNLMRSLLTCLGLVIGIAAVIALMEVGQGTAQAVQDTIATLGANFIQVEAGSSSSSGVHSGAGTCLTLTPQDSDAIARECGTVRWVAPGVDCRMQIIYANRNWQPWKILGTSPAYLQVRNWTELAEGELFTDSDVRNMTNVCLMGQTPARELFGGESPVGKEVHVRNIPLKVIGVLTRKGANMMGMDQDDLVVAPWTTVKFRINGAKLAFAELTAINPVSAALQVNTLSLRYPRQQAQDYPQQSPLQAADSPQLVRFAALVVGGVGVMNIMLVSVTERTREIGLRMAVGARPANILRQFLTEAVLLCLCGGAVGIAVGRGASFALTTFLGWPTVPSLSAVVIAVGVSTAVGIVFGYYPAWRASRLDPIEALRHE